MFFSTILYSVVSILVFGSIRLFLKDPVQNMMLPICALRCGFEATSPLGMSGNMSGESSNALDMWEKQVAKVTKKKSAKSRKEFAVMLRSCKKLLCTAGSMYTFDHSIVLCSFNNCIQQTCNYLVTFP